MSDRGSPQDPKPDEAAQPEHLNVKVTDNNNEVFFKIRRSTQLKKLMDAFCERSGKNRKSVRFLFDGQRVTDQDSPDSRASASAASPPVTQVVADQIPKPALTAPPKAPEPEKARFKCDDLLCDAGHSLRIERGSSSRGWELGDDAIPLNPLIYPRRDSQGTGYNHVYYPANATSLRCNGLRHACLSSFIVSAVALW